MASGDTLAAFTPHAADFPATGAAALDARNRHLVIDFDATTNEAAYFEGFMPAHYSGGGITLTLVWLATTATTGDVVWLAAFERHQDDVDDLDAASFAADNTATGTTAGVSGEPKYTTITFTDGADMDSVVAGESFRLRITRNAADVGDTMTGDAELLRVILSET